MSTETFKDYLVWVARGGQPAKGANFITQNPRFESLIYTRRDGQLALTRIGEDTLLEL